MFKLVKSIIAVLALILAGNSYGQLTTSTAMTPTQLVQNILVGNGVAVSNITYTGSASAIGSFNGASTNIGLSSGILLTTGTVANNGDGPHGPNNSNSAGTDNGFAGNALLTNIAGNTTYNAAVLEFDFIPQSDSIKFRYVFGSEEYPEYVCADVNDAFAFFISGNNPSGGTYNNQNIALVPGTSTPITINTVNGGVEGSNGTGNCSSFGLSNAAFYVDNTNGTTIQYDGFTVPIQAAAKVNCGETYHLRIAIADAGDGVFDSGIFLEANSLNSFLPIQMSASLALDGFGDNTTMAEGCETATITITRDATNAGSALTIPVMAAGTATEGVDYESLPGSITFNPGQTTISFDFDVFSDAITEGIETVIVQLDQADPCGNSNFISLPLKISDVADLQASVADVTVHCPGEDAELKVIVTGGLPQYTYNWSTGSTADNTIVSPTTTTSYTVTVNDICLGVPVTTSGTVNVPIYPPLIMLTSNDTTVLCPNTPQTLYAEATGGEGVYDYTWTANGNVISNSTFVNVSPMVTTTYTVTVTDACGVDISEDITITVTASVLELEMSPDQLICPGDSADIWVVATEGLGNYTYYWQHSGETTDMVNVRPNNTTTYTVFVEDACHTYSIDGTTTVNVERPQANFNVLSSDPMENLLVSFQNTSVGGVNWYWDFGNGGNSSQNSPGTVYSPWGWYDVTLIAYNEIGCTDTISKPIYIKPEFYFYAPNAFTPDGNRFNNNYEVSVIGAIDFEFQIFNRWGELIFQTNDPNFKWAGDYQSNLVADGVLVYKAKIVDLEKNVHDYTGMITILR